MPDIVAFDWERKQLIGLDARTTRGRVRIAQCFRIAWPEESETGGDVRKIGEWLKQELQRLNVDAGRVLVSLPREEVVVRQLDVPDVPDEELPELVRLQAETKTASSLDRLVLDFLPLPRSAETPGRQVLMVSVPREKLDRIRGIIEAAGLELAAVGISPIGAAELVARTDPAPIGGGDTTLIVARQGRRLEISLMRQAHLIFTHSTQLHGEDDEADSRSALAEIRRTLGAQSRVDAELAVTRAWVIGAEEENRTLRHLLTEQVEFEVGAIDPLVDTSVVFDSTDDSDRHSAYAGPLGMLLAESDPLVRKIDFLNPRREIVRPDRRRLKLALASAGVLLVLGGLYGYGLWRTAALDERIASQRKEINRIVKAVKDNKALFASAKMVAEWDRRSVDPLAQLIDVNQSLPGTATIYLTEYKLVPSAGSVPPRIEGVGFARTREDIEELERKLSARGYGVQPRAITADSPDSAYPFRLELNLTVPANETGAGSPHG